MFYKRLRKAAAERDEVERALFRQYAQDNWVANQLVFVDETSKDNRTIYRHYGHAILGRHAHASYSFTRSTHYSLVAAISIDGYMSMRVIEESVDSAEFFRFIIDEVVCVSLKVNFITLTNSINSYLV